MCPTSLRSVHPGFGTSDDLLSVYDRSDARSGTRIEDSHWFCGCGRGRRFARGLVSLTGSSALPLVVLQFPIIAPHNSRSMPTVGSYPKVLPSTPSIAP